MTEQQNKEKEYLLTVSQYMLPNENPFAIRVEEDKELFVISPANTDFLNDLDTISRYKTLFDTVSDLTFKISFSLRNAIETAYSSDVLNEFDLLQIGGESEWSTYYYIENALFRIEALWDILAQIYNVKYALEDDIKNVYHSRIFSNKDRWVNKYWKSGMPDEIKSIMDYFMEDDNTDITESAWKGNYRYVNSLRNDMTHKFSISRSSLSSYAFELKNHPSFIIKRVAECFSVLQGFIWQVCESIMEESPYFKSVT